MKTYNIQLNVRANMRGLYVVYIRVTENRKKNLYKTGIEVLAEHFNPKGKWGHWIRTTCPKYAKYNADIEALIEKLKENPECLKKNYVPKEILTVEKYFDQVLESVKIQNAVVNYKSTKSKLYRFRDFVGADRLLDSINPDDVQRFKLTLIHAKLSNVTINNIIKCVNHAFKLALKTDVLEKNPFRAYTILKEQPSKKQRLSDSQIKDVENFKSEKAEEKNWPELTRDMYLFSYYNAGIRVGDLMQLRVQDITAAGRLEYEMSKTGHKKSMQLSESARRIISPYLSRTESPTDYIFPVLDNDAEFAKYLTYAEKKQMGFELRQDLFNAVSSKTAQLNSNLKIISTAIKLEKPITFHTARHSFADKARRSMKNSNKITLYDIKNALGHKSITTTEKYIESFDKESLDEAMMDIFI